MAGQKGTVKKGVIHGYHSKLITRDESDTKPPVFTRDVLPQWFEGVGLLKQPVGYWGMVGKDLQASGRNRLRDCFVRLNSPEDAEKYYG